MGEPRNQAGVENFGREIRLALGAALVSLALAACGGGGDDAPAAPAVSGGASSGVSAGAGGLTPAAHGGRPVDDAGAAAETGAAGGRPVGGESGAGAGAGAAADDDPPARVASAPGTTTLSWNPPTATEDGKPLKLTGYRIYWGQTEGYYPHSVTLKNPGLTRYVVEHLEPATWYFVATALSDEGESVFSNVIAMKVL